MPAWHVPISFVCPKEMGERFAQDVFILRRPWTAESSKRAPDPSPDLRQVPSLFEKIERCLQLSHIPVLRCIRTSCTSLARKHLCRDALMPRKPWMAGSGVLAMISIFPAQLSLANGGLKPHQLNSVKSCNNIPTQYMRRLFPLIAVHRAGL